MLSSKTDQHSRLQICPLYLFDPFRKQAATDGTKLDLNIGDSPGFGGLMKRAKSTTLSFLGQQTPTNRTGGMAKIIVESTWEFNGEKGRSKDADMGVSKNCGTSKWIVTLLKWMIWGYTYFWVDTHIGSMHTLNFDILFPFPVLSGSRM